MAIQNGITKGFLDLLTGAGLDVASSTFKVALYGESADLDLQSPSLATDEVSGSGYTAGGASVTLTVASNTVASDGFAVGDFVTIDISDVSWVNLTASPRAAVLYRVSDSKILAIVDFGRTLSLTNQTLNIVWPSTDIPMKSPIVIRGNPTT